MVSDKSATLKASNSSDLDDKIKPGRGVLNVSRLPRDIDVAVRDIQWLHNALERELGVVDLILTDNRRRMVSIKSPKGRYIVRLHHMFVRGGEGIVEAIVKLALGDKSAKLSLQQFIERHREGIRQAQREISLEQKGEHHDLHEILQSVREVLDDACLDDIVIGWGRYGRGRRSIRFGSFDFQSRLIRIHPALDKAWVPEYFVSYVVYHELLHALYPPQVSSAGRCVHTKEFRQAEQCFAQYEEAMAWEKDNLHRFLG